MEEKPASWESLWWILGVPNQVRKGSMESILRTQGSSLNDAALEKFDDRGRGSEFQTNDH